jgi:hypothetical protein
MKTAEIVAKLIDNGYNVIKSRRLFEEDAFIMIETMNTDNEYDSFIVHDVPEENKFYALRKPYEFAY